jgi:hypothetical protein
MSTSETIDIGAIISKMAGMDTSLRALLVVIENLLEHTDSSGPNHACLLEMKKGIWSLLQNTALVATLQ